MKRWHYLVLAGAVVAAGAYLYVHRQELGLASAHPAPNAPATEADANPTSKPPTITWQHVDRTKDGFKLDMPVEVKDIEIPAYNEHGDADQVKMIFSNPSADTTYSVAWADNPPVARVNSHAPERTLDMARDDALARTQTSLINETQNAYEGFPSREFQAHNVGGGILNSRLIFAGSRLYMLTAVFPSASARRERDVTHFFNSFTITTPAGTGTTGT
jgi:hypothetical protein